MKILQIINSLGTGGAEKLLLDLIPKYNAMGIQMDVLLLWNNKHQFTQALLDLNCCKVYILSESERIKDIYSLGHILKMKVILKNYDIAHVHLFPAQYFTVFANMLNGNKTKLIFTEHSINNMRVNNSIFRVLDRIVYKKYNYLVCITPEIKDKFSRFYKFNDSYYKVIENGINLDKINKAKQDYTLREDLGINTDSRIVLQVSAFRNGKDQDTVIRSLKNLSEDYVLILVGDGVRRTECEALVEELQLQKRVFFLGQRMDVPELMKAADYIVLSSKYEGLSLASVEGMASGKPFIASDVTGLHEIVNGAGVLFEYQNDKELASIIVNLDNDIDYRTQVIERCKERAKYFDISKMMDKHIQLYELLLAT